MILPYYLLSQPAIPLIEEEQKKCEKVFTALQELRMLFNPSRQPDIEDHETVKKMGERIAELSLQVHDGLLECMEYDKNTYYPRVLLIPTWAIVHDLFCQFAVDWCAKYTIYEKHFYSELKERIWPKKEDKLLNTYIKLINNPFVEFDKMYKDSDIPMICETVINSLNDAGEQMCAPEKYAILIDQYNASKHNAIDEAMSILAYGIQCFLGMLIRLEKKTETLWMLNDEGNASLLRQYEQYKDQYGEEIFMEILRSFAPDANENNLPPINKNAWKRYYEKKLAELMGTSIGREGIKGFKSIDNIFSSDEFKNALCECLCNMDEFHTFLKLYYQYEISQRAYLTMKEWENKDMERISALEFFAQIKSQYNVSSNAKKSSKKKIRNPKIKSDTFIYKWLATDEHRIGRLFLTLQNNAGWIDADESPDNFYNLFKGDPKEFHIKWCGKKQHLFHLFKVIFNRGLVTWGRKNGQWQILQCHFKNKQGYEFSSFNGEKESIKARVVIEKMVDILDPTVTDDYE